MPPPDLLSYSDLTFTNISTDSLYRQAEYLAAPKPIFFKLDTSLPQNAAAREFTDFWLVWLRVQTAEKVGHELAHIIVELRDHTPVLDPDKPIGPEREFLGSVVGLIDHPIVHETLRQAGLDDERESREALRSYLAEVRAVTFGAGLVHPFMAVGFANMFLTHAPNDKATFAEIEKALGARSPETLGAGQRIVALVNQQRATQAHDTIARRVCDILNIQSDFRNAIWPWDRKVLRRYQR